MSSHFLKLHAVVSMGKSRMPRSDLLPGLGGARRKFISTNGLYEPNIHLLEVVFK